MASTHDPTLLLERSSWIHALARGLVQDPELAADLAQDTLVQALERDADPSTSTSGWMVGVLRNTFRKHLRGDSRRREREANASRSEDQPSTLDVIERAATHRTVVDAVLNLDEPYRTTILLRYFEGLSHQAIAKRLGVARPTVNSRITRGLAELRERLEARFGHDRSAFLAALVPLTVPVKETTVGLLSGVHVMHVLVAAGALSLVTVTFTAGLREATVQPVVTPTLETPSVSQEEPGAALETTSALPAQLAQGTGDPFASSTPARTAVRTEVPTSASSAAAPFSAANYDWEITCTHSLPLSGDVRKLLLNTRAGDIKIEDSTSGQVEIEAQVRATADADGERSPDFFDHVDLATEKGMLRIDEKHDDSDWSVSFIVRLPRALEMLVNTGSGDLLLRNFEGSVTANTGSGDVLLQGPGAVAKKLHVNTGSGDVRVDVGDVTGALHANSGAGDVAVLLTAWDPTGLIDMNSGSGDVALVVPSNVTGHFEVSSGLGEVTVPQALGLEITGGGEQGQMKARGQVGGGQGRFLVNTGVGDALVQLASERREPLSR